MFNTVVNKHSRTAQRRGEVSQAQITAAFAALADPTRRRILRSLSEAGELRVTSLARPFRISLPAISRHLRVLEKARLIERHRAGRLHLIRARTAGLKQAQEWMARCAEYWDARFDALDELLKSEESAERRPKSRNKQHKG
jgi:DNA-binding transcriptional ArsR family regulator